MSEYVIINNFLTDKIALLVAILSAEEGDGGATLRQFWTSLV